MLDLVTFEEPEKEAGSGIVLKLLTKLQYNVRIYIGLWVRVINTGKK